MSLCFPHSRALIERVRPHQYRQIVFGPLSRLADAATVFSTPATSHSTRMDIGRWHAGAAVSGLVFAVLFALNPVFGSPGTSWILYRRWASASSATITPISTWRCVGRCAARGPCWPDGGGVRRRAQSERISRDCRSKGAGRLCIAMFRRSAMVCIAAPGLRRGSLIARRRFPSTQRRRGSVFGDFARFAEQAFKIIDWLPSRATAAAFAIVGDFEDAVFCWRTGGKMAGRPDGIVLASGVPAPLACAWGCRSLKRRVADRVEIGTGDEADVDFMQSAVGLVWRAIVLWLVLLLLFGAYQLVAVDEVE